MNATDPKRSWPVLSLPQQINIQLEETCKIRDRFIEQKGENFLSQSKKELMEVFKGQSVL